MTALDQWLKAATRGLAADSARRVRTEIQAHYDSARETAIGRGLSAEEADRSAVKDLGDPKAANRQYRKVLLTTAEGRMLGQSNREARAFCANAWMKSTLLAIPATALLVSSALFLRGEFAVAGALFAGGLAIGMGFIAPFFPVYTPARSRMLRRVKWALMAGALLLAFGPDALKWSWLLVSCLWIVGWIEWKRASIRRKLPVARWPKQLYL